MVIHSHTGLADYETQGNVTAGLPVPAGLDGMVTRERGFRAVRQAKGRHCQDSGTIRSYCLHAGAYSATKGSGYQIAVLKGSQAKLISALLGRSASHREIPQLDVQVLIWGIEAGNKFSSYPHDFQARVHPLLTAGEIALMEVHVATILDRVLPADL